MNYLELKEFLTNKLADYIGTYDINGAIVPAIKIGALNYPKLKKSGLEIILNRVPSYMRPGLSTIERCWTVTFIQHPAENLYLYEALEKLAFEEYVKTINFMPAINVSNDLNIPDQAIVEIRDDVLTLALK